MKMKWIMTLGTLPYLLSGCYVADRVMDTGSEPPLTRPQDPTKTPGYTPVVMPMPASEGQDPKLASNANSLWQTGAKGFFKDQRAKRVGDVLTILIVLDDKAEASNKTERNRDASENMSMTGFIGLENNIFSDPANIAKMSSKPSTKGEGKISRKEKIDAKISAVVTQMLPNGNLVVMGRQELRVNMEVREMQVQGVVRPSDINSDNTISLEKIAEARVSYGGRGTLSDVQQPGWGQQLLDTVAPF